jgi:L-lactate dehydrogenase complex protein LldE
MVKVYYPDLLKDSTELYKRAVSAGSRTHEFSEFIVNVLGVKDVGAAYAGKVALHHSCHLLRELNVKEEPLLLLNSVRNLQVVEMERAEACCGFGGLFSLKYPDISGGILQEKIDCIKGSAADTVAACDLGCLMHIAGALSRQRIQIKTAHIAELLANT